MAPDKLAKLKSLLEKDRLSQEYKRERIVLELGENIVRRMEELGINRAELAKRLGVSNAMVTKMLRGNANFTLSTLVGLATALEQELSPIEFAPMASESGVPMRHPRQPKATAASGAN